MKIRKKNRFPAIFSIAVLSLVILMTFFPALFTSYDPLGINLDHALEAPSMAHLLGTDEYGRDIFCRIVYGARNTIYVGFAAAALATLVGVPLGLSAGYFGGILDLILMRIMDAFLSFPPILLAILTITILTRLQGSTSSVGAHSLVLSIALVNFPRFSRIVRGSVLSLREREFVEANRSAGAGSAYIMFRTILPNCVSAITVQFTLLAATSILIEAGMSFIGLGLQPPEPAWGSMLFSSLLYMNQAIWYVLSPTATIFIVVLAINFLGDVLRDWFDPRKQA